MIKFIKKTLGVLVILSFFSFNNAKSYSITTPTVNTNDILTKSLWNIMVTDLFALANEFKFIDGDTETDAVFTAGNVGIGTTNPTSKLNVITDDSATYTRVAELYAPNNNIVNHNSQLIFGQSGHTGNSAEWRFLYKGDNDITNRLDFGFFGYANPAMSYLVNGNVGIGTTTPNSKLHIHDAANNWTQLKITNTNSGSITGLFGVNDANDYIYMAGTTADPTDILINTGTTNESIFLQAGTGNVGIGTTSPTTKLEVIGDITADAFLYSSDERLKENINDLDNFADILNIEPKRFDWKEDKKRNSKDDIGVIAQNVEQYFPEFINTNDNGIKSVDYPKLTIPLIGVVKAQQKMIESLENRIKNLENK